MCMCVCAYMFLSPRVYRMTISFIFLLKNATIRMKYASRMELERLLNTEYSLDKEKEAACIILFQRSNFVQLVGPTKNCGTNLLPIFYKFCNCGSVFFYLPLSLSFCPPLFELCEDIEYLSVFPHPFDSHAVLFSLFRKTKVFVMRKEKTFLGLSLAY